MKTRYEIENNGVTMGVNHLEVLLDIRELLIAQSKREKKVAKKKKVNK